MWSYFRLFFSKNYWALVRRRHFWRDSWVAARRAHKDRRARKQMRLLLTVILTPVLCLFFTGLLLAAAGSLAAGQPGLAVGFLAGSAIAWVRSRNARREAETLKLFAPETPVEWVVSSELRRRVAELALVYAVMGDRAGSEGFLAVKTLPEGFEVATRRVHVSVLKEHGLWDRLGAEEKDLLLRSDGHWENEVAKRTSLYTLDLVRVLRWVLRVDQFLPVVGSTLEQDYALAKELVVDPKRLFDGSEVVKRKALEIARDAAHHYFQRCAAEGVKRGYFEPESEKNAEWSRAYSDQMAGRQSEDLLLGTKIVSEADEGAVRLATVLALRRYRLCVWLVGVFAGETEMVEELRVI
jgi:hypothetical protein